MFWLWLIVALAAAIAEMALSGLVFAGVALAAVVAAVASFLGFGVLVDAIVFAATTLVYLAGLRPTALRLMTGQSRSRLSARSGPKRLIGQVGIVTEEVSAHHGQIRIGHGEFWSARAFDGESTVSAGTEVEVLDVDGLTALVGPGMEPPQLPSA